MDTFNLEMSLVNMFICKEGRGEGWLWVWNLREVEEDGEKLSSLQS